MSGGVLFLNNRRFSQNRRFYDCLMREIVCEIYERDFEGMNKDLILPFFYRNEYDLNSFRRIGDVLSDDEIALIDNAVREIRKAPPKTMPDLKNRLLAWFPRLTTCHLEGLNVIRRFEREKPKLTI